MKRKEFISVFGKSGVALALAGCLGNCSLDSNPTAPSPANVDFTLDLNDFSNSDLNNIGGSIYKDGIVIGKISQDSFVALSQACPHQGTTVQFQLSKNIFHCPNHGSNFNLMRTVLNGPASQNLKKYNTELTGNLLRVFS